MYTNQTMYSFTNKYSGTGMLIAILFIIVSRADCKPIQHNTVCLKNYCFDVEVATEADQHARGLMFRKTLARDKGMLFIFPHEKVYPFWMKNTLIPLDIIWFNKKQEIIFISKDTQPCKAVRCLPINPPKKILYVLEINGGIANKIGLSIGTKMTIEPGPNEQKPNR